MAYSKAMPILSLVFRLLTLVLLALSMFFMARNKVTFNDGEKGSFKDVIGYRYTLATGAIGIVYNLLQVPTAVYLICAGKRMTGSKLALEVVAYSDMIIAYLLATGVGAGFAATLDLRKAAHKWGTVLNLVGVHSTVDKFFRVADISCGFLFLGFLSMAALCVVSFSIVRRNDSKRTLFG